MIYVICFLILQITDEETDSERISNSPKVTHMVWLQELIFLIAVFCTQLLSKCKETAPRCYLLNVSQIANGKTTIRVLI